MELRLKPQRSGSLPLHAPCSLALVEDPCVLRATERSDSLKAHSEGTLTVERAMTDMAGLGETT